MKMDRKLVARLQPHEVQYIANKFDVKPAIVRDIVKKVGRSRAKIYAVLTYLQNTK